MPFFLEPEYSESEEFEETNRVWLVRKWGGSAGWEAQKRAHALKERGPGNFGREAYVRCSDSTFYDLLNMMNQGTSILLPVAPHLGPSHFEATAVRRAEYM